MPFYTASAGMQVCHNGEVKLADGVESERRWVSHDQRAGFKHLRLNKVADASGKLGRPWVGSKKGCVTGDGGLT